MGEIIASLDSYFSSPAHNFDWTQAEASRLIPQRGRSHGIEAKEFGKNFLRWQWPLPDKICRAVARHYSQRPRAVNSAVERLVYTDNSGLPKFSLMRSALDKSPKIKSG
jgi:hypothetical protein